MAVADSRRSFCEENMNTDHIATQLSEERHSGSKTQNRRNLTTAGYRKRGSCGRRRGDGKDPDDLPSEREDVA